MIKNTLYLFIILFISCQSENQTDSNVQAPEIFDSFRDEIIQLVKEGKTPSFSVAVLQNDSIIWKETFEQTADTSFIITSGIQYPIASLTKSMSAILVLKLAEMGQLSLDDKVDKYLPKLTYYNREFVTIQELLNMTAGIPHGWMYFNSENNYDTLTNNHLISNYGISVFPSGVYEYSNYSYGIIEALIEKVTNKTFSQSMEELLFHPAGMENSFVPNQKKGKAENNYGIKETGTTSKFFPAGGAGVYSNINDLITYARLHLKQFDESILSHASIDKMHYDKEEDASIIALGMGSISLDKGLTWLISNGSFPESANSNLTIIPEKNIAVICLANRDYRSSADMMAIKIADVMIPGFAEKAFAKMEAYESNDYNELDLTKNKFQKWEGFIKSENTEYPVKFDYLSDSLYVSLDNGDWQSLKGARIDHQSIIRGGLVMNLINPITKQEELSEGGLNILITENKLQGYFSATFIKENSFNLALPFYIEARGVEKFMDIK